MRFDRVPGWKSPYIIAEVGSNWTSLDDCLFSIRAAKSAGANAVKFQLFDEESLYGHVPKIDKWLKGCLNPAWLKEMKAEADFYSINFMCSAFSPAFAEIVNPFVNIHKIASAEMNHVRLLETTNSFGKPVILSTAAHTISDIEKSLTYLTSVHVCLMYCIGSYPAKDIDLRCIRLLEPLSELVGYSDHSTDVRVIPRAAVHHGAQVIEKHFTAIEAETPDSPHSLNVREFGLMVKAVRNNQDPAFLGHSPDERDMLLKHKRRLKVTRRMKAGDKFVENVNFGAYRSLDEDRKAISPYWIDELCGRMAKYDMEAGHGIGPDDVY